MKSNGFTEEYLQKGNMPLIFGLAYVFSVILSFFMTSMVIHQHGVVSAAMSTAEAGVWSPEAIADVNNYMATYGNSFRSFGHGAIHGVMISIFCAVPLFGINALFERRGLKYILIHWGYWVITLALIGGVLCKYLEFAPLS